MDIETQFRELVEGVRNPGNFEKLPWIEENRLARLFQPVAVFDPNIEPGVLPTIALTFHPFQLVRNGSDIRVVYGTVNSIVPSGMSIGDDPPYTFTPGASGVAYVKVTTDATTYAITAVDLGDGATIPADTATTFYQELGSYTVSGSVITLGQTVVGSLEFLLCGGAFPTWWGV